MIYDGGSDTPPLQRMICAASPGWTQGDFSVFLGSRGVYEVLDKVKCGGPMV